MMGGPLGALFGFLAGRYFDKSLSGMAGFQGGPMPKGQQRADVQAAFFETTFLLAGHIAKADGRVSEEEIAHTQQLFDHMGLSPEHRQQAIALFKQGAANDFDMAQTMQRFNAVTGRFQMVQQTFLQFLFTIAMADGVLDDAEKNALREIAGYLGIGGAQFEQLVQMMTGQQHFHGGGSNNTQGTLAEAYEALGCRESDSDKDVKRAYRKLMSQNHPDKLIAQGVPEDMIKLATERSQEIQNAYEVIKKQRGI